MTPTTKNKEQFTAGAMRVRLRRLSRPIPERLWTRLKSQGNGCWAWTGAVNGRGYGIMSATAIGEYFTHRVAWTLWHGRAVPADMHVCHHCDNPPCCNPEHLFLGSTRDNNADKIAKGRHNQPFGESHANTKLTNVQVFGILQLPSRVFSNLWISKKYGIATSTVQRIRSGRGWKHVHALRSAQAALSKANGE